MTMQELSIRPMRPGEGAICEHILRSLPEWFGIESALLQYARDAETYPTVFADAPLPLESVNAHPENEERSAVGFLTIREHFAHSAEIHCMAVMPTRHRKGIGRALVEHAQSECLARNIRFLQVKTLGPSRPCEPYDRTRKFYQSMGFVPLEEIPNLWPGNPCLIMIKKLS